jgi:hypothetical protein
MRIHLTSAGVRAAHGWARDAMKIQLTSAGGRVAMAGRGTR